MKKLLFLLAIISIVACTAKDPVKESTLSGTVQNIGDTPLMLFLGQESDTILINEDGSFSITKELEKASGFLLRIGRNYSQVFLAPGLNLTANFNAEDLAGTIEFEGDLALESKYLQEFRTLNNDLSSGMADLFLAEPEEYREGVLKIRTAKEDFLNNYTETNAGLNEAFIANQKLDYEFSYYYALSSYEPAHNYYAKIEKTLLPDDWYSFEDDIVIDNPDYLDLPVAVRVVSNIISKNIEKDGGPGEDAWGTPELLGAQFDWIIANIKNQDVVNYFLDENLTSILDYSGPGGIEKYIDLYFEKSTDLESIDVIKEKVEVWAPISAGNEAPAFTLPDIDGNEVSLSDFAGKYVYIDFWATWCGPCKIEIPVLEELAVKYADKNIEIMSISVDKDKQAWIDMVTRDKPQWLQLHDGINMNDDYLVKFIPSFVLIDREGKILQARAPRPSSGEVLEDLLNSLEGI